MKKAINSMALVLTVTLLTSCEKVPELKDIEILSGKYKTGTSALPTKPNVLVIVVDDLRYWSIGKFFEQAGLEPADPSHGNRGTNNNTLPVTPKIDAFIDGGAVAFTNAHSSGVECCPSRTALLFGKYPHESGVYRNGNNWWTSASITESKSLTRQFVQDSQYKVYGAGKIYHGGGGNQAKYYNPGNSSDTSNFKNTTSGINSGGYTTVASSGRNGYQSQIIRLNADKNDFSLNPSDNVTEDAKAVTFCINKMKSVVAQNDGSSFFVTCGIRRPHSPLIVPENYFNNAGTPKAPKILPVDTTNLPNRARYLINNNPTVSPDELRNDYPSEWDTYLKAYAGAVSYSDAQIGRLINYIDSDPQLKANTIIVLISDHGFNLGDKHHVKKTTLYEETTRVPMIWRLPNHTPGAKYCKAPVDLMSIYPTLMALCNLSYPTDISGRNISNLLTNPGHVPGPDEAALTVMDQKSSTVRTKDYRFIQYNNGGPNGLAEELYNHRGTVYSFDPWEARDLRNKLPEPTFLTDLRQKKNTKITSWADMVSGGISGE